MFPDRSPDSIITHSDPEPGSEAPMPDETNPNPLQAEVDRLRSENRKLMAEVADLGNDLKEVRAEARDRRHEAKSLNQQVADLTADRDKLRSAAGADPDGLKSALAEAQATIRTMKHEQAFTRVARELKVSDPDRLADLITVAKYAPAGDEPDDAKIAESFKAALERRPYLLDTTPGAGAPQHGAGAPKAAAGAANGAPSTADRPGAILKPGPGADRGQSQSTAPDRLSEANPGRI
jgi:outer membrane murein-binding lipoprotein Lpp